MHAVRSSLVALVAAATLLPLALEAQRRTEPRRQVTILRGDSAWRSLFTQRRARLGVTVDIRNTDTTGALLETVTPGGPAARAGLRSGDIITRVDGKVVSGPDAGPRLIEVASQLKADQTITIEYLRDGSRQTATLTTGDEPIMVFEGPQGEMRFTAPDVRVERFPGGFAFGTGPGAFSFEMGLMNLQLAPMNPELGQYFGTSEGILVIDIDKESSLGVKPGDVILSVDGRKASGVAHLFRILRSYDPGDSFKLEIVRNKNRMTVTGQIDRRG